MPAANMPVAAGFPDILRKATSSQHSQLESAPLSKALLSDGVSLDDYINYLEKMRDVIAFCEHTVFPIVQPIVPAIDERRKLKWIEQDLLQLTNAPCAPGNYHPFTNPVTKGFALGYMYVIEGSTLGGRVILKHLHTRLGISPTNSGAFFAGYGEVTGSAWKSFLHSLQVYVDNTNCGNEVIKGAKHAFSSIYDYFLQ